MQIYMAPIICFEFASLQCISRAFDAAHLGVTQKPAGAGDGAGRDGGEGEQKLYESLWWYRWSKNVWLGYL